MFLPWGGDISKSFLGDKRQEKQVGHKGGLLSKEEDFLSGWWEFYGMRLHRLGDAEGGQCISGTENI